MSLSLQGLPSEITAEHKFVVVDTMAAAEQVQRLLPAQVVLWPETDHTLDMLPLESWMPLQGNDVLLWATNSDGARAAMATVARAIERVTDRVRMVYVNGEDPGGFSASEMGGWTTAQLVEWAKPRTRQYSKPDPAPSSMDSLYAEPAPPFPFEREPGMDDEPGTAIAEETDKPERRRIKWTDLEGKTPPERNWIISHWLTHGPTLLAGQGGIGKTLLAQMIGTAIAMGRPYIDEVKEPANVLFWACEDDHDELWRRQIAICNHMDIPMSVLEDKLIVEPRLGLDNALMLQQFAQPTWTPLRQELRQQVNDYKASVLIVDNIGQCFGGNENDRHHVTAFLSGLVGLSDSPLAVLMLGHPAKAAGSEYSGSTAWETAVRMRWYMGTTLPDQKPEEGEEPDSAIRYLCKRKANYSQLDYRVLTYTDGAYACDAPKSGPSFAQKYGAGARNHAADTLVQAAIEEFFRQRIRVTAGQRSPDYFVEKMRQAKISQDYTTRELNESLMRLRMAGKIVEKAVGTYANRGAMMGLAPA